MNILFIMFAPWIGLLLLLLPLFLIIGIISDISDIKEKRDVARGLAWKRSGDKILDEDVVRINDNLKERIAYVNEDSVGALPGSYESRIASLSQTCAEGLERAYQRHLVRIGKEFPRVETEF